MILAQATQPAETWVWSNLSPEKIAFYVTVFTSISTAVVLAIFGLLKLIATQWLGLKSTWQKGVEDQVKANADDIQSLAQASPSSSVTATPAIKARVDQIAKGE